jgi:predicted nucleic acid-binding protein
VIHVDTSFLIDLLRETTRERPGAAFDLIESLDAKDILGVSVFVVCELRAGAELFKQPAREHAALDELLDGFVVTYPEERFAMTYARQVAILARGKKTVEAFDLLIASAALLDDAPLVTKNVKDFSRVPGLRVIGY